MALQKQLVPLRFGQGIDTKIDPKQQLLTSFARAVNVTYETVYSLKKRNGYRRIQLQLQNATNIAGAEKIISFKNELGIITSDAYYGFSSTTEKLSAKGAIYSAFIDTSPVNVSSSSAQSSDVVVVDNLEAHSYALANGEVRFSLKDNSNKSLLAANVLVGSGSKTKIAAIGGYFYVFYISGTNLYLRRTSIGGPESFEAPVSVTNLLNTSNPHYDIDSSGSEIFVAYNSSVAASRLRVVRITISGISSGLGVASSPDCESLCIRIGSDSKVNLFYASTTTLYYTQVENSLLSFSTTQTTLEAVANVFNIGAIETTGGDFHLYYTVSAANPIDYFIKQLVCDTSGAIVTASSVFKRSLILLAHPFVVNTQFYIPCVFASTIQSTSFILDASGSVVAKVAPGVSSGLPEQCLLGNVEQVSSTLYVFSQRTATKIEADNGTILNFLGTYSAEISFSSTNQIQTAVLGENLHLTGGLLRAYDGDEISEHGFNMYPELVTNGGTATTGGFMSNGTYSYAAVYMWVDNYGQEHRSSVSAELNNVVLSGGTGTQTQVITVPTLRVTDKTGTIIEVYRTENNGSVYYLAATAPNNSAVDSINITCTISDSTLISKLPLYNTGDVLDNGQAPNARVLGAHTASGRLMAVAEDGNLLLYSKIRQTGGPVEWNEALAKPLDPIGGRVTAITSMDEKAIIFKESAIMFIGGTGPNNLGQQDNFTEPELVASDVGCTEPSSIVLLPMGLMFKSNKGIYILSRSLELNYIGAPVEAYNNSQITSAKVVPQYNQVRFTTLDNECLVLNYALMVWSTFDNHQALGAETIGNTYYYLRDSGELFQETPGVYKDNNAPVTITVETAWMSFMGIQGFQRIYKMLVLGDWKSEHNLQVDAAYDFNPAWVQTKLLDPTPNIVSGLTYGDDNNYGSGSPYGGDGDVYQARFDFKRQKCQSIKLRFVEQQTQVGEGLSLSLLTLEVGGKRGLFKPKQSKISGLA